MQRSMAKFLAATRSSSSRALAASAPQELGTPGTSQLPQPSASAATENSGLMGDESLQPEIQQRCSPTRVSSSPDHSQSEAPNATPAEDHAPSDSLLVPTTAVPADPDDQPPVAQQDPFEGLALQGSQEDTEHGSVDGEDVSATHLLGPDPLNQDNGQ